MARPARKKEMLQAAAHVFSRRGFHGATIREIARRTGMLSGSLYVHIRSKEDLLFEIVTRTGQQFIESVQPVASGEGPAARQLREALKAHLRVVANSIDEATVFLHEWKALRPARREQVRRLRDAYERLWDRILQNGIRSGEFRAPDPAFARLLVLSVANWAYHWFRPDGPLAADEVAERFADLLLGGLAAPGAGGAARDGAAVPSAEQPQEGRDGAVTCAGLAAGAGAVQAGTGRDGREGGGALG